MEQRDQEHSLKFSSEKEGSPRIKPRYVVYIVVTIVAVLAVTIILFLLASRTTDDTQTSGTLQEQQQYDFPGSLNSRDFLALESSISDDAEIRSLNTDCCSNKEELVAALIAYLVTNEGGFEPIEIDQIDLTEFGDVVDLQALASEDGKYWIAYDIDSEGRVTEILFNLNVNIEENDIPGDRDISEIGDPPSDVPLVQPVESAGFQPYVQFTGGDEVTEYVEESKTTGSIYLPVHGNMNLMDANCVSRIEKINPRELIMEEQFNQGIHMTHFEEGRYRVTISCNLYGVGFGATQFLELKYAPPSICDEKEFVIADTIESIEDISNSIVGTWRGCAKNPWTLPYQVEFTFKQDWKYTAINKEVIINPKTLRTTPPLYYDSNITEPGKDYKFLNQYVSGELIGIIQVFDLDDELNNLKISSDGSKLYFEVIHKGRYGPLVYELERVG